MIYHSVYFDTPIWRQTSPSTLRWFAFTPNGPAAADTLRGIRRVIKQATQPVKRHE